MKFKEKGLAILKMLAVLFSFFMPVGIITGIVYAVYAILGISSSQQASIILLITSAVSVLAVLLASFVIAKIYKIKIKKLGILFSKDWLRNFGIGIGIGTLSISLVWLLSVMLGGYSITINNISQAVLINIFISFITMLMISYYEEVLTRGLMSFVGAKNSKLFNAVIVGLIFSLLHLLNSFNNPFSILAMINTFFVAIVFSQLTWVSGDLWVAIGYHMFWNFTMGSILGVPISGIVTDGFLISSQNSDILISGGSYGLEGSIICTVFLLAQIVFIYIFFIKRGKINKEPVASWLA